MSPKVDEKYKEERRRQILGSAYKCFSKIGFDRSTMRDICKEANLSPGAVYSYFSSKQEIINSLVDTSAQVNREIFDSLDNGLNSREKLREILLTFCTRFDHRDANAAIRIDISIWATSLYDDSLKKLVVKAQKRMSDNLKELVEEAQSEGTIKKEVDPEATARLLLSILIGAAIQKYFNPKMSMNRYKETIIALFKHTI